MGGYLSALHFKSGPLSSNNNIHKNHRKEQFRAIVVLKATITVTY